MGRNHQKMYAFKPFVFIKHEPRGSEKPKARSGHRIACDHQNLYSYGGFNPLISEDDPEMRNDGIWQESKPLFKELWKFNLLTREWHRLPCQTNMPKELASNAVVLRGHTLMVYGGTGIPFGHSCSNHLYIYNVKDGRMKMVTARGDLPPAQYGQALVCDDEYLYTVGGTTGSEYTCDIHRFDFCKARWEPVYICSGTDESEPKGRYRHEVAFDGSRIYILGGGTATEAFGFRDLPVFDLEKRKWLTVRTQLDDDYHTSPAPRRCHGSVQYTDERTGVTSVVISGGCDGSYVFSDVWRLELNTLQWSCLKKCILPNPVYFHSTALTPEGCMYTFGGIIKKDNQASRTEAVHSVWLTIPKLSEICWQALNHYNPNLKYYPPDELLPMGVPNKFVQRIENDAL